METVVSNNLFYLIHLHYNYIEVFDRQNEVKYRYKGISIAKKDDYWEYKFEILNKESINLN